MPELIVGQPARDFNATALTRQGEKTVALGDYANNSTVVLYFYPKDDTPGCTTQACGFRDLLPEFEAVSSTILGVSPDSTGDHKLFAEKFTLPFPLLSDPDHAVAEAYGVWKEKTNYGRTYLGIERTTFVIDKTGVLRKVFPRVKVDMHASKVLEYVKTLTSE